MKQQSMLVLTIQSNHDCILCYTGEPTLATMFKPPTSIPKILPSGIQK